MLVAALLVLAIGTVMRARRGRPSRPPNEGSRHGSWHRGTARAGLRGEQGTGARLRAGAGARGRATVTIVARTEETLRAHGGGDRGARAGSAVQWVACDITTPEGRAAALAACPQPDILVNNAGGPPPGDFRDWDRDAWIRALDANMLTPIELIKATVDGMIERALRPHRQHHLGRGEGADRHPRPVQRRALRPDRLRRRPRAQGRAAQRHDQQPAARPVRHRPAARHAAARAKAAARPSTSCSRRGARRIPAGRFGSTTSSAPPARSCAACTPASSSARTCCSTAAPIPGTF